VAQMRKDCQDGGYLRSKIDFTINLSRPV